MSAPLASEINDDTLTHLYEEALGPVEDAPMARLRQMRDALADHEQTWNDALIDPDILLCPQESIPTAPKELAMLASCWRRNVKIGDLARISHHPPAICRNLRNRFGVVFAGNGNDFVERHDVLGSTRRIQGFAGGSTAEESSLIRLSAKDRQAFLRGKQDPLTGSTSTLQIDHRVPASAARKVGRAPDTLSKADLEDGTAEELFQALNRTTNARKREVCEKCLAGGKIEIPPVAAADKPDDHWRQTFDDARAANLPPEAPPCLGCFWHRPEHSFAQACQRWKALNAHLTAQTNGQDTAGETAALRAEPHGTTSAIPPTSPPET